MLDFCFEAGQRAEGSRMLPRLSYLEIESGGRRVHVGFALAKLKVTV